MNHIIVFYNTSDGKNHSITLGKNGGTVADINRILQERQGIVTSITYG